MPSQSPKTLCLSAYLLVDTVYSLCLVDGEINSACCCSVCAVVSLNQCFTFQLHRSHHLKLYWRPPCLLLSYLRTVNPHTENIGLDDPLTGLLLNFHTTKICCMPEKKDNLAANKKEPSPLVALFLKSPESDQPGQRSIEFRSKWSKIFSSWCSLH